MSLLSEPCPRRGASEAGEEKLRRNEALKQTEDSMCHMLQIDVCGG